MWLYSVLEAKYIYAVEGFFLDINPEYEIYAADWDYELSVFLGSAGLFLQYDQDDNRMIIP